MLRKIRTTVAIISFALITLLFLDFTGTLHYWFGWLAKIQFLPALLALNIGVILFLLVMTLVLGRVYCSVICPLGVFQDFVSWAAGKWKKNRFSYSPAKTWLRYGVLLIYIIAFIAGFSLFVTLLEPYSAYGRIASNLFAPIYQWGNNGLAYLAERMDSYTFYSVDIWVKSTVTFVIAASTFIIIAVMAWRNGRTYCNTICPVGSILGFLAKFSYLKPTFDIEKCNKCGLCARNCKASCIDSKEHKIDYSRCVICMDCIEKCPQNAISYLPKQKVPKNEQETLNNNINVKLTGENSNARRNFLTIATLLTLTSAMKAQQKKGDGGLAVIKEKKIPNRTTALTPPGSISASNLAQHCTACQLCISACPNQVLRPSENTKKLMQPEMSYERGYCRPECVRCSEVCPTGAIHHITTADKSSIQIGHAEWIFENCVVNTDNVSCGNCARHCPTGAIKMVPIEANNPNSPKIPVVNTERCIGCGTCENLCPARPLSAIYVEGHERHRVV